MKCENCVFQKDKVEVSGIGVFYACKLSGISPEQDCVYFREKGKPVGSNKPAVRDTLKTNTERTGKPISNEKPAEHRGKT